MSSFYCRIAKNGHIQFKTNSDRLTTHLKRILDGWCSSRPIVEDLSIHSVWHEVSNLPSPPPRQPDFVDTRLRAPNAKGNLSVYDLSDQRFHLLFRDCAYVQLDCSQNPIRVEAFILSDFVNHIALEDVVFAALAGPLRRQGIYFVHGFAAVSPNAPHQAVMFVGPSQSGKTSTGLNLLLNRWRLLANDVVALQRVDDLIYAFPIPNLFSIRPNTFRLLPQLQRLVDVIPVNGLSFTSHKLINGRWGNPTPVQTILLPKVRPDQLTQIVPVPKSICTSLLLEESVDTWDITCIERHTKLLIDLVTQSSSFAIEVGSNINQIPKQIMQAICKE